MPNFHVIPEPLSRFTGTCRLLSLRDRCNLFVSGSEATSYADSLQGYNCTFLILQQQENTI